MDEIKKEESTELSQHHNQETNYSENPPAKIRVRYAARALDSLFLGVINKATSNLIFSFAPQEVAAFLTNQDNFFQDLINISALKYWVLANFLISTVIWIFLVLKPLKNHGQTLGKRLLKIKMLSTNKEGKKLSYFQLFFREWILLSVSSFFIMPIFITSKKKRFLHDFLGETQVVAIKERKSIASLWFY